MAADTTTLDDKVRELTDRIKDRRKDAAAKWAAFDALRGEIAKEGADISDGSDAFRKAEEAHKEYAQIADEIAGLESTRERLFAMTTTGGPKAERDAANGAERLAESFGRRVVEGDAYRQVRDAISRFSGRVELGAMTDRRELHALIVGADPESAGAFVTPDRRAPVFGPDEPLFITQMITVSETDSDLIEYVRETGFTNNAAFVAEATTDDPVDPPTVTLAQAGVKPQSVLEYEVVQEAVKTLAHWIAATRRSLSDAAQLRSMIDGRLRFGLSAALQEQVIQGNGSGENLTGILSTPGVQSQDKGSDTLLDALHKAITKVRLAYHEPNAIGIHPNDWQTIRLLKDTSNGGYLFGPPSQAGPSTIWGIQSVVQAAFPTGNPLVGDFRQAELWIREGAQVLASDSHVDFFVRNIIALLAEMRVGFGVPLPEAFCEVTS